MSSPQRRRVAAVLAGDPPDQVPLGELFVEDGLVAALAGLPPGAAVTPEARYRALDELHLDVTVAYPELPGGRPLLGAHLARNPAAGEAPHAGTPLGLADPDELDWTPVRALREATPLFTLSMLPGPFGELAYLEGIEQLLVACWRRPDEARRLGEAMVDYALALAQRAWRAGAQGFVVGEDVAWDGGLLLRPDAYRDLFLPALRREVAALRSFGAPVVFHSDGDFSALLDEIVALGVDGLHGWLAAPGGEFAALGGRLGPRPCRWGNLDLDAFALGDVAALEARVDGTIAAGNRSPGFLFGTSAGILDAALPAAAVRGAFERAHAGVLARSHRASRHSEGRRRRAVAPREQGSPQEFSNGGME